MILGLGPVGSGGAAGDTCGKEPLDDVTGIATGVAGALASLGWPDGALANAPSIEDDVALSRNVEGGLLDLG